MSNADDPRGSAERWIRLAAAIAAPVTLLSALLFYFGYVSTRATYEYFGVDVDTVGLGTQEFIMRSPRPLLVPLIGLLLLGTLVVWAHAWIRARLATATAAATEADAEAGSVEAVARIRRAAQAGMAAGGALLAVSGVLVVLYPRLPGREAYDLVIPVLIAVGAGLLAYGRQVARLAAPGSGTDVDPAARAAHVMGTVLLVAVIIGGLFWATAVFAQWSGRGEAVDVAARIDELPSVIVDTTERLYIRNQDIRESSLPIEAGQQFRYRYEGLRLLVHGGDRMFLVPAEASPGATTALVALNDSVRVQFQFQNPG